jgi:outer membrane protein OmpU
MLAYGGFQMRRILLGSTALAAIAVLGAPGAASAEEGLKLTLGGRYLAAFGGLIGEDDNLMPTDPNAQLRDYVVKQDVEIHFKGETTFDNGLTVGVRVELEGQTSAADQIDAVYAYFDTKWGELRFGDTLESLASLCYTVPSASNIFGADSPIFNFSNAGVLGYAGTNGTCYGIDSKSTKVVYFSPTFGGFNFAVSFTPDDTEDTRNTTNGAGTRFSNNFGQNSENISVGATYEREFNGFGFVIGGGGSFSLDREYPDFFTVHSDNREELNAYAQFRYAGFTLGGAYSYRDAIVEDFAPGDDRDAEVFGAGATYAWSRYAVGMGWTRGRYENGGIVGSDQYDVYALTGSYVLGPGITIDGLVGYSDYEGARPFFAVRDYQAVEVGVGTSVRF